MGTYLLLLILIFFIYMKQFSSHSYANSRNDNFLKKDKKDGKILKTKHKRRNSTPIDYSPSTDGIRRKSSGMGLFKNNKSKRKSLTSFQKNDIISISFDNNNNNKNEYSSKKQRKSTTFLSRSTNASFGLVSNKSKKSENGLRRTKSNEMRNETNNNEKDNEKLKELLRIDKILNNKGPDM